MTSTLRTAAALAAVAFWLTGCAGGASDPAADGETSSSSESADEPTEDDGADEEAAALAREACSETVDPLLTELNALDSRLNSGLQFERYTNLVADAQIPYNDLVGELEAADGSFDDLGGEDCIYEVARNLELALQRYTEAGNVWNDCVTDFDCVVDDDALPEMQDKWQRAADRIADARSALAELGSTSS